MADIAELIVALKLRDGVSSGLGNLNRELKGMQGGLRDVGRGVGQVGRGLDQIMTRGAIAAGAALTGVVTTAASFEQAFTGVEKTVDGTEAQLAELEETLRGMARTMPVSFEELAAIGEAGGALGIARDSLDEFVDVVARLAVSTDLSSEAAATSLGQLANVLHLEGAEIEEFADTLVALGNAGASTESQIVEMAARFGAAGNTAGLTKEEVLALSSAVASMGIEVEAGGSSLSRLFGNVATAIGTGGDEVEAFTDLLGLTADEFQTAWGEDALGTFQDFLTELGKLDQFAQARVLEEAGITGVRDINAVRLMAQNVEFLGEQLEIAKTDTGALDEESQKFFDTTAGQWQILQNNVRDAAATLGAELLPVVNEVMGDFVDFLQQPGTQQGIKDFARDLASGVEDLVTEIRNADFGPLIDTMKGAAAIAKGAFDAFRSLPQPIQQLALAAIVANKVTGGAVGSIASGLGNILKGVIKIGFDRGSSPLNPMFVKDVGLKTPLTGGVDRVGGTRGGGTTRGIAGIVRNILKFVPVVIAAEVAEQIGPPLAQVGADLHDQWGIPDPPKWLNDFLDWNPFEDPPPWVEPPGGDGDGRARGGSFDSDAAGADTVLTRDFGGKLDQLATNEVIEHLARTTEIGLKDVGTSFQVGVKTGMDPLGDIATKILTRAEDPKAPAVMTEIQGHLLGLEEIQAAYLASGDTHLAEKVQTNIDTLHRLIGTVDSDRAVTQARAAAAASSDAAMLATARLQTAKIDTSNARLSIIAAKDPKITVNPVINFNPRLSPTVIMNQTVAAARVSGTRPRLY